MFEILEDLGKKEERYLYKGGLTNKRLLCHKKVMSQIMVISNHKIISTKNLNSKSVLLCNSLFTGKENSGYGDHLLACSGKSLSQ